MRLAIYCSTSRKPASPWLRCTHNVTLKHMMRSKHGVHASSCKYRSTMSERPAGVARSATRKVSWSGYGFALLLRAIRSASKSTPRMCTDCATWGSPGVLLVLSGSSDCVLTGPNPVKRSYADIVRSYKSRRYIRYVLSNTMISKRSIHI